ncbi:V-type ATP synthase subunit D [Streptomyces albogriseolus]|uniref:V-type ATP synthase subunit D n=1 Tax=Streptomyces albogriseolus TaxID=1887 RepID=UPI003CFB1E0A
MCRRTRARRDRTVPPRLRPSTVLALCPGRRRTGASGAGRRPRAVRQHQGQQPVGRQSTGPTPPWAPNTGAAQPPHPTTAVAPSHTAVAHAGASYADAVCAAAEYAAAHAAAELLGAEVAGARHRVRALRRHCIPRLREALHRAGLTLEQSEHEDGVRRRWAADAADR